jgi:hypothetical protein
MIFVVAGNHSDYQRYCADNLMERFVYLHRRDQLKGIRASTIRVTTLGQLRPDFSEILKEARVSTLKVEYVK